MTVKGQIERLVAREHHEPHAVLGPHPSSGGVVVRAYRPGAKRVVVLPEAAEPFALRRVHPEGVFSGRLAGASLPLRYRLEVQEPSGDAVVLRDPYSFPPLFGELDLHLAGEGRHEGLYERLGAHPRRVEGCDGVAFAVWAPNARSVSVVGDFNGWDGRVHQLRSLGASGIWELFVPGAEVGAHYKFELRDANGALRLKADPLAFETEAPPRDASVVTRSRHAWHDGAWLERRAAGDLWHQPVSIYEAHLGSWRLNPLEENRSLTYDELAEELGAHAVDLGFTHVELLPVMEHPYTKSWGYQPTGFFAPTARFGDPDGFRRLVDSLHAAGLGVILDWVPGHFPKDDWALARFDGTALYEHADPRRGEHPDWGTLVFNHGRAEVRNFLLASALYWLREHHADGLRVDAVASMLYLDYSRAEGEWVPNPLGGREDLDAVAFLRELNEVVHGRVPGVLMVAEESTAWPGVSRPTHLGGLGFGFKWNMGWMNDTLSYFSRDPVHRRFHHHELTFSLVYAFSENYLLPLSHDEVVHGKGSLLQRMPGDRAQQLANLRALYAYMWAHPGKKLLFMGGEIAQEREWDAEGSIDWHLLEQAEHRGVRDLVRHLNGQYRAEPALHEIDGEPEGFDWLELNDADANVIAFARFSREGRMLACLCNLSSVPRDGYRVALPRPGPWREVLNTDSFEYGGSGIGNAGLVVAEDRPWRDHPFSAEVTLPPLGVVWLVPEAQ
ncbi:MAG: 1,4-alpha-glucan branching protein GlgB [Gaiellaceae bacterium]